MKKITQGSSSIGGYAGTLLLAAILSVGASSAFAFSTVNTTLDLGDSGSNVTNLQEFFAANPSIYPEGLVTGYFGGLTRSAIQRFQISYGIVSSGSAATTGFGRVGPSTRASINDLINHGGWSNMGTSDVTGPAFSSVSQSIASNFVTFAWNTNEGATGKVVYSTSPLIINEGDINSAGFGAVNGLTAMNDNTSRTSQQISLTGLMPNTYYYYMIVATDASGNISIVGPNNTFRTNP